MRPIASGRLFPAEVGSMYKSLLAALFAILVPVLSYAQSTETPPIELSAGDIFRMASPSVVRIEDIGDDGNPDWSGQWVSRHRRRENPHGLSCN